MTQEYKVISISVIKGPPSSRSLSGICESLKDYLGWNPGYTVLERKIMVEQSLALMERIRKVVESTCFTNGDAGSTASTSTS